MHNFEVQHGGAIPIPAGGRLARGAARRNARRAVVSTAFGTCELAVHTGFAEVSARWRELERVGVTTPYHRHDFIEPWYRLLGRKEGITLCIVEGRFEGAATGFIWPLGICRCFGARTLSWLGGKHANYGFGLYAPQVLGALTPKDWTALLDTALELSGADLAVLLNQPESYGGGSNPLAHLRLAASTDPCHRAALTTDYDTLLKRLRSRISRRNMRRNLSRMEEAHGPVRLIRAEQPDDIRAALEALVAHKAQLDETRPDKAIFADTSVVRFLEDIATETRDGAPAPLDIYTLVAGDQVAATFGCVTDERRASGVFISIDIGTFGTYAPGELLIGKVIEDCCARGLSMLDLGVGGGSYKERWCHYREPLFDAIATRTLKGRFVAAPLNRAWLRFRAAAKRSRTISALYGSMRSKPA